MKDGREVDTALSLWMWGIFFFFGAAAPIWALAYLHETHRLTSGEVFYTRINKLKFDFIHFWSVTLVNTIKTTSFI
jgi:hypothetical protein